MAAATASPTMLGNLTPGTPTFPPSALHQPGSHPASNRGSIAGGDTDPTSPIALPNSPATPAYAATMNADGPKPPSPTNPSNSTREDAVHTSQSVQSFRHKMQQQAMANSGLPARKSRGQVAVDSEWNPKHPCFPHPNVHVPITSPIYDATRIIRIPRDWMEAGDLYPVFSETYPEILLSHVSEQSFRDLISQVNATLKAAYEPASTTAIVDGLLGALSGWMLEDAGLVGPKRRIKQVEAVIEKWNNDRLNERNSGERYGPDADIDDLVMVVPLRRTAYMSLDIQIPDPKLNFDSSGSQASARSATSSRRPSVALPQSGAP